MASNAVNHQASMRRGQVMRDQHNRQWSGSIEIKSGFPTGLVVPEFTAPDARLYPGQKYLLYPANEPGRVVIDYPRWIGDLEEANLEFERRKIETGAVIPGGAQSPMFPILMGPPPMSPNPVRAMQQGNKWALGLSTVKPPEAELFFPTPLLAQETPVFSGPVFSQEAEARAERMKDAGQRIAERMAELEKQVPEELKGFARTKWLLEQLKGETVAQEA